MVKKEPLLNLTVEQILTMGDEALNKTNKRQLSHMLRTVSLAAKLSGLRRSGTAR